jgi:acetylornithine deacetylase/succinyl-diaminopimelate desuccinylase-like protein
MKATKKKVAPIAIDKYIDHIKSDFVSDLKELVDIPSVSMDPNCKKDITKTAVRAKELINKFGATAEIILTDGNPVVIGKFHLSDDYPTVTVYNHLDVQPADAEEWETAPFSMQIVKDKYLGRGTTDDKGPALTALYAANYAHENKIPININFLWELEEEIGGPNFARFLEVNKDNLKTNSIVVSDTIWVSRDKPAISYGLRGMQCMTFRLDTGKKDLHSGLTGGLARNPIGEMAHLISKCYDAKTGEVKIPHFYDDVKDLEQDEIDNFIASGFNTDIFQKAHELYSLRTTDVMDAAKRIWAMPTFEVHGLIGGYTGPGVKTIVPHFSEAKVSMRLVPNQDPNKIIQLVSDFVRSINPDVEICAQGTLQPYVGDFAGPYSQAAKRAMQRAFGKEPAFVREGGSIGAVLSMKDILNVPITFLGLSLPEHGYHSINENYDWQQASGGIKMFVHYFEEIVKIMDPKES